MTITSHYYEENILLCMQFGPVYKSMKLKMKLHALIGK